MRCEGVRCRSESVTVILMLNTEQRGSSSTAEGLLTTTPFVGFSLDLRAFLLQ